MTQLRTLQKTAEMRAFIYKKQKDFIANKNQKSTHTPPKILKRKSYYT